jgi:hypothetical protein
MNQYIKIFQQKLGSNTPLRVDMKLKDMDVVFGMYDTDVVVEYVVELAFNAVDGSTDGQELLYDEIFMRSAMDVTSDNDVFHINLREHKLVIDINHSQKDMPKRNTMDITPNEYREFIQDLSFSVSELKEWMNDVVLRGDDVKFPYYPDEFDTEVVFTEHQMTVMIEVGDDAYKYMEKNWWDYDYYEEEEANVFDDNN